MGAGPGEHRLRVVVLLEGEEISVALEQRFHDLVIVRPWYGNGAEALKMRVHELRVKQSEAAAVEPRHKMNESHLGGISGA